MRKRRSVLKKCMITVLCLTSMVMIAGCAAKGGIKKNEDKTYESFAPVEKKVTPTKDISVFVQKKAFKKAKKGKGFENLKKGSYFIKNTHTERGTEKCITAGKEELLKSLENGISVTMKKADAVGSWDKENSILMIDFNKKIKKKYVNRLIAICGIYQKAYKSYSLYDIEVIIEKKGDKKYDARFTEYKNWFSKKDIK